VLVGLVNFIAMSAKGLLFINITLATCWLSESLPLSYEFMKKDKILFHGVVSNLSILSSYMLIRGSGTALDAFVIVFLPKILLANTLSSTGLAYLFFLCFFLGGLSRGSLKA
jgi:hypothetical protein